MLKLSSKVFALAALAVGQDMEDATNRPVSRVVNLLRDMQAQMEKEQEEDEKVYDEIACWCSANDKEKTQAIKDAEVSINHLTGQIESLTAQSARLGTEISNLEKEISANTKALDKAIALRRKALADFTAEEKDFVQSISSLKSAIIVLRKHHESLLQGESVMQAGQLMEVTQALQKLEGQVENPKDRRTVKAFLSDPSYNSQSGEIFGIMKNMLEEFERSLAESQKNEKAEVAAFQRLKKAKSDEIAAATEQLDAKTGEKANADEKNAQSKNEREDTQNSLSADEKFLMDLKEKCKQTDDEWEQRTKSRQEEIVATSQAIKILSADDARDNFSKTVNTSFVQKTVSNQEKAAQFLTNASKRLNNSHLSVMAARVRLDAFTKVRAAISEMITQLDIEKKDEIKHKDWCVNELNKSKNNIESTSRDRDDAQARIDSLVQQIKALTEQIDVLDKEIKDLNKEVKRGGEDREKANAEFQVTLQDQRTTQKLLKKAKDVLARVYDKKTVGTGFSQTEQKPPTSFKNYEKKDGGGVMGMLNQIINDSKAVEAEAIHDEEKAQEAYESFIVESNRSIAAKTDAMVDAKNARAKNEIEQQDEENNHAGLMTEIEQLTNNNIDIHSSCDFVLKNFDIRQQARDEEMEALRQADAILAGSNFKSFLQKA